MFSGQQCVLQALSKRYVCLRHQYLVITWWNRKVFHHHFSRFLPTRLPLLTRDIFPTSSFLSSIQLEYDPRTNIEHSTSCRMSLLSCFNTYPALEVQTRMQQSRLVMSIGTLTFRHDVFFLNSPSYRLCSLFIYSILILRKRWLQGSLRTAFCPCSLA